MTDRTSLVSEARHELARFPVLLDAMVAGLTPARWRARPAPDEWSPVEIVCHLRDEEAEDFGARVRVILSGSGRFTPIDPQGWATTRCYHADDPAEALAAFRRHRAESLAMLDDATAERLEASGEGPSGRRLSGLDLLCAWVAHDGLHLRQLAGTLIRQWVDHWAPLRGDYAGPIPYSPDNPRADP